MKNLEEFEKRINYTFKNKFILKKCLTHRSYASEKKLDYDNQRLEFLGDAVVEIILTECLFVKYQDENEGKLTKMRSVLAQQDALSSLAKSIGLGDYIYLGKGEIVNNGSKKSSILADTFEALIGAIYLDGGFEKAKEFLVPLIDKNFSNPDDLVFNLNPKGMLQEFTQKHFGVTPEYKIEEVKGPHHRPSYTIVVSVKNKLLAKGMASKRKNAESEAAKKALKLLREKEKQLVGT